MNINHILQYDDNRWRWNSNTSHTCVWSVYQSLLSPFCSMHPFLHVYSAMGTRLGGTYQAQHTFHYKNLKIISVHNKPLLDFNNYRLFACCVVVIHMR